MEFIGTCVNNPFDSLDELIDIIDNAEDVSRSKFIRNVDLKEMGWDEELRNFFKFPTSYTFHRNGPIWFFVNSAIEHFFKEA